jgi:hypothetical protein
MWHVLGMSPYRVFVGNRDRAHGRPVYRCKDNIKMNFKEIGFEGVHSTDLGADGWVVCCCEHG